MILCVYEKKRGKNNNFALYFYSCYVLMLGLILISIIPRVIPSIRNIKKYALLFFDARDDDSVKPSIRIYTNLASSLGSNITLTIASKYLKNGKNQYKMIC